MSGDLLIKDISRPACKLCDVYGRFVKPDTSFKHRNNCIEYPKCVCECNGRWNCRTALTRDICTLPTSSSDGNTGIKEGECQKCNVFGLVKVRGSQFIFRNNCDEWRGCGCNCDGSLDCSLANYSWICDNVCRNCSVRGIEHEGDTDFDYTYNCITYNQCHCNCNGSWECPAENATWTCTDTCAKCMVYGGIYAGNSTFSLRGPCAEWDQCICHCNGSWICPKEHEKWLCSEQCTQCKIDQREYDGGLPFQLQKGCVQFNCDCNCDRSYTCPSKRTVNTCLIDPSSGCRICNVHIGKADDCRTGMESCTIVQTYIDTNFSIIDECIEYNDCTCNCDGSWSCPGSNIKNKCNKNPLTGCRSCFINADEFPGNSEFQLKKDCFSFECKCNCDGSWQCLSPSSYVCGLDTQAGDCRDCYAQGKRVITQTSFKLSIGCIEYQCQCECDGRWQCPSGRTSTKCDLPSLFPNFHIQSVSINAQSWCLMCRIGDGLFPGNSQFSYRDGCLTHYLRCFCDGGYMVASTDNCFDRILAGTISPSKSSWIFLSQAQVCRSCIVNGVDYPVRAEFILQVQCQAYRCQCTCEGLPKCKQSGNQLCDAVALAVGKAIVKLPSEITVRKDIIGVVVGKYNIYSQYI